MPAAKRAVMDPVYDLDVSKLDRVDVDALSRRMESEMQSLRTHGVSDEKVVGQRRDFFQKLQKRRDELDGVVPDRDMEGTAQTLADAEGNFATDARVAQIGGIGVKNSNTDPEGVMKAQRKHLEDSGVDASKVPVNQLAGALPPDHADSQVDDEKPKAKPATARR